MCKSDRESRSQSTDRKSGSDVDHEDPSTPLLGKPGYSSSGSSTPDRDDRGEQDGGYGWVIVAASFLCNMVLDGIAYSFGELLEPMQMDFGSSSATISLAGSILAGMILLTGPISASACNRFGPRVTCISGAVISAAAIFTSSFCGSFPALLVSYGFFAGFGLGLMYVPSVVCVSQYFTKRLSLATGICVCGSGAGTFAFAPLTAKLTSLYGWRGCNRIISALCLFCALLGFLMVPRAGHGAARESSSKFNFRIFRKTKFILVLLGNVPTVMATYATYTYLPVMAKDRGLPFDQASYLISAIGMTNTLGRILVGWITDLPQINPILITFTGLISAGVLPAIFVLCDTYVGYLLVAGLFGFCLSAVPTATSALIVELLGKENLNAAFGGLTFLRGVAALTGPPVSGYILDRTGSYNYSFYFSSGQLLAASVTILLAYILHKRSKRSPNTDYQCIE